MILFPPADRGQTEFVLDDEDTNVRVIARMLEAGGFQSVTGLTDPTKLHSLIVEDPIDLVITDWHMPQLDGFAVLDVLSPLINQERLPVLVVTGDAAEYRDEETNEHNERVGALSARLAEAIGWTHEDAGLLRRAAALHDIGKIGIPDALLRKPGALTESEQRVMRTHTSIGARILGGSHVPLLQLAETVAMSHHERWDGTGYPRGLVQYEIPLAGRIVAVADAFDAMTNDRPYRPARPVAISREVLREHAGRHYEPRLVDALERIVSADRRYDASSLVARAS